LNSSSKTNGLKQQLVGEELMKRAKKISFGAEIPNIS